MKIRERGDRWSGTPIRVFGGRGGRGIMGPSTVIGTGRGGLPTLDLLPVTSRPLHGGPW
jgi:hypothetical protein